MSKSNDYYVEIEDPHDEIEIILPSEIERTQKKKSRNVRGGKPLSLKWPLIFVCIGLIYIFYEPFLEYIMSILKSNPTVYSRYLYFEGEIANNTIAGMFYTAIFGSLFFLAIPSEALFIFFLDSTTYPGFVILLLMTIGNVCGLVFNYLVGRLLGERFVSKIFAKNFEKYQEKINSSGGWILLLGNIFPGPVELLTVFFGSFRYPLGQYIYLVFMGRLIKYIILFILFNFYWESITLFYDDILGEFLNLKNIFTSVVE